MTDRSGKDEPVAHRRAFWNSIWDVESNSEVAAHPLEREIERVLAECRLDSPRVLEVGSGLGALQGLSPRYVGTDLAATCGRLFRLPARFVCSSADQLPFAAGSFDFVMSIYVLEHVHDPGAALEEIRRVCRSGGTIYLKPAFFCRPWTGASWFWKPYRELSWIERLHKASVPVRNSLPYRSAHLFWWRLGGALAKPRFLRIRKLMPNFEMPEVIDADAESWLDPLDIIRWFSSRGDRCISHESMWASWFRTSIGIVVQVDKSA